MSLTTLPPELFSCVVANIESQSTIANLAQCSRHCYHWTTPHLYRHVRLEERVTELGKGNGRLPKLASLLIRRPDLATLVRYFTLQMVRPSWWGIKQRGDPDYFKTHVDPAFTTAVSALSLSKTEEDCWLKKLRDTIEYHPDVILALLLPALLKVEKILLNYNIKHDHDMNYLEQMIQRAACRNRPFDTQPPFQALTAFVYSHRITSVRSTLFIASLLKLPAIQIISEKVGGRRFNNEGEDKAPIELERSSSPLTSLDIADYVTSTAELGHILRAPKALKTFSYAACSPTSLDFTDIRRALEPHETCLESLGFDYVLGYKSILGPMPSFISFNSLKVFKTAAIFLERTENGTKHHRLINIFPPSLEMLHVTRFRPPFECLLDPIIHLLAQKSPKQIPSLTRIILEEHRIRYGGPGPGGESSRLENLLWEGTEQNAIERLSQLAAAQGVTIDVTYSFYEIPHATIYGDIGGE